MKAQQENFTGSAAMLKMKRRLSLVLSIIIVLSFLGVTFSVARIQFIDGDKYRALAIEQQMRDTSVTAERGAIYDRNMKILAQSATVWTLFISPTYFKTDEQREFVAESLSVLCGIDKVSILEKSKKNNAYEVLKKNIEEAEADLILKFIADNELTSSIGLGVGSKRYYPFGDFASGVLGFTGADNQGLAGLEAYYDKILSGTNGKIVAAKNGRGTDMPFKYEQMHAARNGYSIVTTIDETIQHILEKNLATAVVEHGLKNKAAGIVMNLKTGEILAMASKNDFDPNDPFEISDPAVKADILKLSGDAQKAALAKAQQNQWRIKAISDPYEPGSVFKPITMSMFLEQANGNENTTFSCPGYYVVADRTIRCHLHGGHGTQNAVQALMNSCNPALMRMGELVGAHNYFKYFEAYGLTAKTGIDLPGEAAGIYHPEKDLRPVELAVSSFGQTFKITPIQMLTAIAASTNGGKLLEPHMVRQVLDDNGNIIETIQPKVKRQVISAETSKRLSTILEKVVSEGGGRNGGIIGYKIGGKTGTSEKIDKRSAGGEITDYVCSFVAVTPTDDPEIGILVILDEPLNTAMTGSIIAAPVAAAVLGDILPYLGFSPTYSAEQMKTLDVVVPAAVGKMPHDATSALQGKGLVGKIVGNGPTVTKQVPSAGEKIPRGSKVILYTDSSAEETTTVPDVMNLAGSVANKTLTNNGLNIRISSGSIDDSGSVVYSQSPAPGEVVKIGSVITLEFRNMQNMDRTTGPDG